MGPLIDGFAVALTFANLGWCLLGVTLGTAIGILPGIGPALTIALLLPVTAHLDPTGAFIMFAGLYYGAMYGSSTTSILLNTPGETGSIITAIEGNLMARQGRGAAALATAAIGSFVAGTIGTVLLTLLAPIVVKLALRFGPAEYFALMVVAFTTVSGLLGSSRLRGMISLFLGLAIGLVGTDSLTGQARFTLGSLQLLDGIDITVVAVGLFAVGEALYVASRPELRTAQIIPIKGSLWMTQARSGRARGSRGCAARSSAFRSARCRRAARRSRPSSPISWKSGSPRSRKSSARARSRASRGRKRPTIPPSPACWCRC